MHSKFYLEKVFGKENRKERKKKKREKTPTPGNQQAQLPLSPLARPSSLTRPILTAQRAPPSPLFSLSLTVGSRSSFFDRWGPRDSTFLHRPRVAEPGSYSIRPEPIPQSTGFLACGANQCPIKLPKSTRDTPFVPKPKNPSPSFVPRWI